MSIPEPIRGIWQKYRSFPRSSRRLIAAAVIGLIVILLAATGVLERIVGPIILLGLGALVVQRFVAWPMEPMLLRRTSPEVAYHLVIQLMEGINDGGYGFPSGFFFVDDTRSSDRRVVVNESVEWGSRLGGMFEGLSQRVDGPVGCLFLVVAFPLFLGAYVAEVISKVVLRSQIQIDISSTADVEVTSRLTVKTRGPCAHMLRPTIRRAFGAPVLPERIAGLAGMDPTDDRRQAA